MDEPKISINCIEVEQPIGTFYIGAMEHEDLLKLSFADVRRMADPELETYLGIQRELSPLRIKELNRYVDNIDATFPTSIILAISSEHTEYDSESGVLEIHDSEDVAKVIDGQHRIEGLKSFTGETFQLNVTIFVDMDIEDQAMVFATINIAQTKVNKSLVYDLFEFTKSPSPQKTSHNIAKLMNSREGSPFEGRIKILGRATEPFQVLTQAAIVESLLRLISGSVARAEEDRQLLKMKKKPFPANENDEKRMIFRNMFLRNEEAEIAKVIWNYFHAVQDRWPKAWKGIPAYRNMLPRTNGFRGLMRFLPHVFNKLGGPPSIPTIEEFADIFASIKLEDHDFTTDNYEPGSGGESALYKDLLSESKLD